MSLPNIVIVDAGMQRALILLHGALAMDEMNDLGNLSALECCRMKKFNIISINKIVIHT